MLTKSDLQSLLQCPRKLWLEHHKPELVPNEDFTLARRTIDGNIVGDKARSLLPRGFIWPKSEENKAVAAERAIEYLKTAGQVPAAEFPFVRDELYVRADALLPEKGKYVLRETKASTFPLKGDKVTPDAPKEHHLNDVAIQMWAMEASGLMLTRAELNLLN